VPPKRSYERPEVIDLNQSSVLQAGADCAFGTNIAQPNNCRPGSYARNNCRTGTHQNNNNCLKGNQPGGGGAWCGPGSNAGMNRCLTGTSP
jgi:hypothetical protein